MLNVSYLNQYTGLCGNYKEMDRFLNSHTQ